MLIDESGCPGFKLTKGSTPYFVVVMVIFKDYPHAEAASTAIEKLRSTLGISPEFKFTDSRKDNLVQLADMIAGAIARSYSDKRKNASRWFDMLKSRGKISNVWDFK